MRFRLAPYSLTLDNLNGGSVPLLKIEKFCGAHQKKLNKDRPISLVTKCRPMILRARNIKCMRICAGVPSGEGHHAKSDAHKKSHNMINN